MIKFPVFVSMATIAMFNAACTPLQAQEVFVQKPAVFLTRFSFTTLTGGVVILKAAIDNHTDSLNFILDTGSGGISLDSLTVEYLKLPTVPSDRTIRGIAGVRNVRFANHHTLHLPELAVDSLSFHINDYSLLSSVYGMPIDGIIGYSFLRRYIVKIDYDNSLLEVYKPGAIKYPKGGHTLHPTISSIPVQAASVKDNTAVQAKYYLDTGAGLNLLLSEEFCKDSLVLPPHKKRFLTIAEGIGGKKEMESTVLKEFKLGPYKFKHVPIFIFNDEFNVTAYPILGGLIGNDLLRRFNVIINYPHREIHLLPNKAYNTPFDYSYTGLGIYTANGEVLISDVIPGSPADEAGLKVNDVIVGMENTLGVQLQAYKTLLQSIGSKVKIIIRRNGDLYEKKIRIKSIR